MANDLVILDTETRLGALKRETHWSVVLAAVGGGLTYTWIGHLMDWTPALFTIHGVLGLAGGYLVGTGVARALTGTRVRLPMLRYETVSTMNRFVSSVLRILVGVVLFAISYVVAVGVNVTGAAGFFRLELLGLVLPFGIWGVILMVYAGRGLLRAME